jgi:hypothetical protein
MDADLTRISKVLRVPLTNPKWKEGDAWFERPPILHMYRRIAAVMEYIESEFGIHDDTEWTHVRQFLHDLHSAFCNRLSGGESLDAITFPSEVLADYESECPGRFPSAVIVERLRRQFKNYGSTFYDADV